MIAPPQQHHAPRTAAPVSATFPGRCRVCSRSRLGRRARLATRCPLHQLPRTMLTSTCARPFARSRVLRSHSLSEDLRESLFRPGRLAEAGSIGLVGVAADSERGAAEYEVVSGRPAPLTSAERGERRVTIVKGARAQQDVAERGRLAARAD
jgi:hypothetical protein